MRKILTKTLAAGLALSLALTFSCSLGNDDNSVTSGTFTDNRDNKVYKWVQIGDKTWMAENLSYNASDSKCYGEGGKIVDLVTKEETTLPNSEIQTKCAESGRLYGWLTAKASCPAGWHLPSDAEWTSLINFIGGASTAGTKLKSKTGWANIKNYKAGTDNYGFSALPNGAGLPNGNFIAGNETGFWWTATEQDASNALFWGAGADDPTMSQDDFDKGVLLSVRCVLDDGGNPSGGGNPSSSSAAKSGTLTDSRDSKVYKWVKMGDKNWMAENLNYDVPSVTTDVCYENDTENCNTYGRLYDWETAKTSCPTGWHLPSNAEWNTLDSSPGTLMSKTGWRQANGYSNDHGTNDYGFSALPGGMYSYGSEYFLDISTSGYWWSASESTNNIAHYRYIDYDALISSVINKNYLLSIRCVQDNSIKSGTFTDSRDSKVYKWVEIGGKTWMAQNLNYDVPSVTTDVCYENKADNCVKYGRLYDLSTAKTSCPSGWHLPSDAEWTALVDFVGGKKYAGTELKSKTGWDAGTGEIPRSATGTDNFGFSALPGGIGGGDSYLFDGIGIVAAWWTATEKNEESVYSWIMMNSNEDTDHLNAKLNALFSVRCVKN